MFQLYKTVKNTTETNTET